MKKSNYNYIQQNFVIQRIILFTLQLFGKAFLLILVTLFGISIFVSDEHPEKAYSPILVTLPGIIIFVSDKHSEKA